MKRTQESRVIEAGYLFGNPKEEIDSQISQAFPASAIVKRQTGR
jgi:hypothetical protein